MDNTITTHPALPDVFVVDISTPTYPDKQMLVCKLALERLDAFGVGRWGYRAVSNGGPNSHGYAMATRFGNGRRVTVYAHRVITEAPVGLQVSHLNHNPLDNRLTNLDLTSNRGNHGAGKRGIPASGVHRSLDKWVAQIRVGGRIHYLGTFDTHEAAHARYQAAHELCRAAEIAGTPFDDPGFRAAFGLEPVRAYVRSGSSDDDAGGFVC